MSRIVIRSWRDRSLGQSVLFHVRSVATLISSNVMPFFSDFDWDTHPVNASLADHWRVFLGMLIGTLLMSVFLHIAFPNTFWFLKFWSGHAIGMTVGAIAAMRWQINDNDRRKRTSGLLLCAMIGGGGIFSTISLCGAVPDMATQEATLKSFRSLAETNVLSLSQYKSRGASPFKYTVMTLLKGSSLI